VETFQEEALVDPDPKSAGLLEKKWTSVLRLQKKVRPPFASTRLSLLASAIFPVSHVALRCSCSSAQSIDLRACSATMRPFSI
jgi:hypothetical protein